jgi:hypothetical protein
MSGSGSEFSFLASLQLVSRQALDTLVRGKDIEYSALEINAMLFARSPAMHPQLMDGVTRRCAAKPTSPTGRSFTRASVCITGSG